ncbi:sodium-dependent transporter [archaeon]|jgi:neurotransmitter:Na+ symporter, NSS family|nr:sodium-dependent transporter [archaeon]MBT6762674.1 sodium-dependent transporter [archaeon]
MVRARWSSRTIFLFAAIGSAVGLGNLWRFPYLTHKFGGGAFLIPYLIALLVLGTPLLILEFAVGQKLQKGAVDAFKTVHHKLSGIGYGALVAAFIVVTYYSAIMAWALVYFINSFQSKLPWAVDPSGFFFNGVLQISEGVGTFGGINWLLFSALAAVWITIYFCVRRGVKSVGKIVAITMPLPIILLVVLLLRGITLNGAASGIWYYLAPNFAALLSTDIWIAAASQIFFTLSLAFGIMLAYASYNKETQDILGDAYITGIANSAISLLAGFVVFSVLGYMSTTTSLPIEEVVAAGPGLAFIVFPQALSLMPWGNFFSALFFLTLLTLGIDSAFSLVEGINTAIMDRRTKDNKRKDQKTLKRIAAIVCTLAFLMGILFTSRAGLYYLDIIDHFITNFGLIMFGILECLAIGWVYGAEKMRNYINSTSTMKLGKWWNYAIKYFIPLVLGVLILAQLYKETQAPYEGYPAWAILIGWLSVAIPILVVAGPLLLSKKDVKNDSKKDTKEDPKNDTQENTKGSTETSKNVVESPKIETAKLQESNKILNDTNPKSAKLEEKIEEKKEDKEEKENKEAEDKLAEELLNNPDNLEKLEFDETIEASIAAELNDEKFYEFKRNNKLKRTEKKKAQEVSKESEAKKKVAKKENIKVKPKTKSKKAKTTESKKKVPKKKAVKKKKSTTKKKSTVKDKK